MDFDIQQGAVTSCVLCAIKSGAVLERYSLGKDRHEQSDLVKVLSRTYDFPIRKAEDIVDNVFGLMFSTLASGKRIEIRGFRTFTVRDHRNYKGRDPKSGVEIAVKPKKLLFFLSREGIEEKAESRVDGKEAKNERPSVVLRRPESVPVFVDVNGPKTHHTLDTGSTQSATHRRFGFSVR